MLNKTGGSAFPTEQGSGGMTLRDYFAAKALQSLCVGIAQMSNRDIVEIPAAAYVLADAMLAERAK